ncbi:hypothetical protein H5410_036369 [Solanum commersonii]|uniref:Uncharacterized protein n=1 Tax=Solanum commersonii TaxID=4109 RepID=A0A9J5Y401_SOLCO|nr:hypothetical protein H5410_036369 [Solanum commersonii]
MFKDKISILSYNCQQAKLVGIADQIADLPFCRFHRRLALSFNIIMFWIIRRHSTASQKCSATRRLLLFTADLILPLGLSTLEQRARIRPFGDSPNGFNNSQIFISSFFSAAFVPFC